MLSYRQPIAHAPHSMQFPKLTQQRLLGAIPLVAASGAEEVAILAFTRQAGHLSGNLDVRPAGVLLVVDCRQLVCDSRQNRSSCLDAIIQRSWHLVDEVMDACEQRLALARRWMLRQMAAQVHGLFLACLPSLPSARTPQARSLTWPSFGFTRPCRPNLASQRTGSK